jgi:LAS superfamily LD-carboxypeptidase LdcB
MGGSRKPGPINQGHATQGSGAAPIAVSSPGPVGAGASGEEYDRFKKAVLAEQVRRREAQGKTQFPKIPSSELTKIEGKFKMRTEAAASLRELLKDARAAWATAKAANDAAAKRTTAIGITSAYRDYDRDSRAWNAAFAKHYKRTRARREEAAGGPHGRAAVKLLARHLDDKKAPPGFSNHSNGNAVDFSTTHAGIGYGADTDQRVGWRSTWLYLWLDENAETYGFSQLPSEEWHWDYE